MTNHSASATLLGALLTAPSLATAANIDLTVSSMTTVMSGLNAPRGLEISPSGALYVAEAGSAFAIDDNTPFVTVRGVKNYYGETGSVSRLLDGAQTRVFTGLPTLRGGDEATGPSDLLVNAEGDALISIGMGLDVGQRTGVFTNLGNLVRIPSGSTTPALFSDIAAFEGANNPNGDDVHSNPFKLAAVPRGDTLVIDAGANALLSVNGAGGIAVEATFSPTPGGSQAVPTSLAIAPEGTVYVGQLTGFPFVPGSANIFAFDGESLSIVGTGFTHIIDLALANDGTMFVLEHDSNGLLAPGSEGALYAFDPVTGQRSLLLNTGLDAPTGLAFDTDGTLYLSNHGHGDGLGEVIALTFAPIPEPATWGALLGTLALVSAAHLRRRSSV